MEWSGGHIPQHVGQAFSGHFLGFMWGGLDLMSFSPFSFVSFFHWPCKDPFMGPRVNQARSPSEAGSIH